MNKKRWISLAIIAAILIGLIVAVKFIPVWFTIISIVTLVAGFTSGYLFSKKKDEIIDKIIK